MMFQAVVNEDATGSITALQAEIRRLREELEKARGDSANFLVQNKFRDHSRNFAICPWVIRWAIGSLILNSTVEDVVSENLLKYFSFLSSCWHSFFNYLRIILVPNLLSVFFTLLLAGIPKQITRQGTMLGI